MSMNWDKYQQQSVAGAVTAPLAGEEITVKRLSGGKLRKLNRAQVSGDIEALVETLFGDQAEKVWAAFDELDISALQAYIQDVLAEMGLQGDPGEGSTSSS